MFAIFLTVLGLVGFYLWVTGNKFGWLLGCSFALLYLWIVRRDYVGEDAYTAWLMFCGIGVMSIPIALKNCFGASKTQPYRQSPQVIDHLP